MPSDRMTVLDAKIQKSEIAALYQKIAPAYNLWGRLAESRARDRCLELAAIQNGESILEVAVGTGLAFEQILRSNPTGRNEGIDLTADMLVRAERIAAESGIKNYSLRVGDAYDLDFPNDAFDAVINNYMFDLLPEEDFSHVLGEFKRALRPGGRLVMVNMTKGVHWYNYLWEAVYRLKPGWLGGCRGVYLVPYLEAVGFEQIRREFVSQVTFPSEVVYGVKPAAAQM